MAQGALPRHKQHSQQLAQTAVPMGHAGALDLKCPRTAPRPTPGLGRGPRGLPPARILRRERLAFKEMATAVVSVVLSARQRTS